MAASVKKAGRQTAEEAKKTKESILGSATRLFCEKGFDATSIREIAADAHISHGIIRHHFGSKLDIWKTIADNLATEYQSCIAPMVAEAIHSKAPLTAFKQLVERFIDVTHQHPEFVRLMVMEGTGDAARANYLQANFAELHQMIAPVFERAQAASTPLSRFNNDSFFLALFNLTTGPIAIPMIANLVPIAGSDQIQSRKAMIMAILFG